MCGCVWLLVVVRVWLCVVVCVCMRPMQHDRLAREGARGKTPHVHTPAGVPAREDDGATSGRHGVANAELKRLEDESFPRLAIEWAAAAVNSPPSRPRMLVVPAEACSSGDGDARPT